MDEKTRIMISLGAATAANCIPCFEHFYGKAGAAGLTSEEIQRATEIGEQVSKGAQMAIRRNINATMFGEQGRSQDTTENCPANRSCCG